MLDLTYHMPTNIIYGTGCIQKNASLFPAFGKKCLIVTGKNSAKASGALDDVLQALALGQIESIIFDEVEQNPLLSTCKRAGDLARENKVDFIIGIGGGSPLDATKAISIFAKYDLRAEEAYNQDHSKDHVPFFLVGTTAGTGSEVTPYAVITVDRDGRKRSLKGLFAEACFCDYRYTLSLNYAFSVSTALDALSHCIEGYFCNRADTMSDLFAVQGIQLILDVFTNLSPDQTFTEKQRQKLYAASIYGGLVITKTGTSFCHSMGYFLTEDHHVPHGIACAVYLPDYLRRGFDFETKKADLLTYEIDYTLSEICNIIENMTDYTPVALSEAEREELCERWTADNKFGSAPGDFTPADAMELVDRIFPKA
ncbi:Aldehyde-alcohol dehydrogenase [uncultured Ruminococcus sp.]|nr:Aldehyde-alcohol dehydrogenase [uncultured Ruminococcus sp.]SCH77045.1 Aldehyde-alcohol dehydrogenase [uncultured Clostridium sp.]